MKKSEMPKFLVYTDYRKEMKCDFAMLNAKNLFEAMKEATAYLTDEIYLVKIFQRTTDNKYEAILTNRHQGWNDNENGRESEFVVAFDYKLYESRFALKGYIDYIC